MLVHILLTFQKQLMHQLDGGPSLVDLKQQLIVKEIPGAGSFVLQLELWESLRIHIAPFPSRIKYGSPKWAVSIRFPYESAWNGYAPLNANRHLCTNCSGFGERAHGFGDLAPSPQQPELSGGVWLTSSYLLIPRFKNRAADSQ